MAYLEENCPKRKLVRKSMGWCFALLLGLLVCIADIRLPAETERSEARVKGLIAGNAAFTNSLPSNPDEPDVADLSDALFVPTREPELLPFDRIIHEAAGRHHVDADLILAVIMAESQFNPNAKSKKGAKGLMQLMPDTARELGVTNSFDIQQNIDGGARYLRQMLDRFGGDTKRALAAYNAGPAAVEQYNGDVPFSETRQYVQRVMRYAGLKT